MSLPDDPRCGGGPPPLRLQRPRLMLGWSTTSVSSHERRSQVVFRESGVPGSPCLGHDAGLMLVSRSFHPLCACLVMMRILMVR